MDGSRSTQLNEDAKTRHKTKGKNVNEYFLKANLLNTSGDDIHNEEIAFTGPRLFQQARGGKKI